MVLDLHILNLDCPLLFSSLVFKSLYPVSLTVYVGSVKHRVYPLGKNNRLADVPLFEITTCVSQIFFISKENAQNPCECIIHTKKQKWTWTVRNKKTVRVLTSNAEINANLDPWFNVSYHDSVFTLKNEATSSMSPVPKIVVIMFS